jgi:hypothetical protein
MRCRNWSGLSASTERPSSRMSPRSGSYNRFSVRNNVDFPDPDGPMTAVVVPAGTSMSTPRSTAFGPNER